MNGWRIDWFRESLSIRPQIGENKQKESKMNFVQEEDWTSDIILWDDIQITHVFDWLLASFGTSREEYTSCIHTRGNGSRWLFSGTKIGIHLFLSWWYSNREDNGRVRWLRCDHDWGSCSRISSTDDEKKWRAADEVMMIMWIKRDGAMKWWNMMRSWRIISELCWVALSNKRQQVRARVTAKNDNVHRVPKWRLSP